METGVCLPPDRAQIALVGWWLCELFYIVYTVFLKLSVGMILYRIAINHDTSRLSAL
jgi:hypothetical protein